MVGYSLVSISGQTLFDNWFVDQSVSGWGVGGVGVSGVALMGLWIKVSEGRYYV